MATPIGPDQHSAARSGILFIVLGLSLAAWSTPRTI